MNLGAPHAAFAAPTITDVTKSSLYVASSASPSGSVSLLYEAETYTPPFYRGRSLASADAPVRIHADAQFSSSGSINYTWTINGRVMQNLSGVGASDLTLAGPSLYGTLIVSVDARSQSGSAHGTQTIRIPAITPQLTLYSDDPLLGVQYNNAIGENTSLPSNETTLVAVPYFFATDSALSSALTYLWSVNGTPVLAENNNPSRLTLQVDGGKEGTASVSLSLTHKQYSFENSKKTWQIHITPAGSATTPFTNTK